MCNDPEQSSRIRNESLRRFWDWVDERSIVRRSVLAWTMFLTGAAGYYGWEFAHFSKFDGSGTALIIAAFTAPVTILQKAALDAYLKAKDSDVATL